MDAYTSFFFQICLLQPKVLLSLPELCLAISQNNMSKTLDFSFSLCEAFVIPMIADPVTIWLVTLAHDSVWDQAFLQALVISIFQIPSVLYLQGMGLKNLQLLYRLYLSGLLI